MARVTVEDCVDKVENRFELVLLAGHRARQISSGAEITVDRDNDKNPVVALREIADETLSPGDLEEDLIHSLQKQVEVRDSLGWVQRIMDELPEQQRMVLQLRDVEAYDYEEIEKLMDMKPTAVRVTLSRARKAVREKLLEKHRYGIG